MRYNNYKMNGLAKFYARFGRSFDSVAQKANISMPTDTFPLPTHQTPGRHIYYDGEIEANLPDDIKWEIRMPSRYAVSTHSRRYLPQIEEQVMTYMRDTLKYNTINPESEFSLDMKIRDGMVIAEQVKDLSEFGDSGELQKVWSEFTSSKANLDSKRDALYDALNSVYEETVTLENQLVDQLQDTIPSAKINTGKSGLLDAFQGSVTSQTVAQINTYLKNNTDAGVSQILAQFGEIANTRAQIAQYEAELIESYLSIVEGSQVEKDAAS